MLTNYTVMQMTLKNSMVPMSLSSWLGEDSRKRKCWPLQATLVRPLRRNSERFMQGRAVSEEETETRRLS